MTFLLGSAYSACLGDEQLIKDNEGEVNFKPDSSNRSVCWGCNASDMQKYLNLNYDHMAQDGSVISLADCNKMFAHKLADARASADKIFGKNKPSCSCARATAVDVIYDISPAIAEVELQEWKITMDADNYLDQTSGLEEAAYDWLYAYQWCYMNGSRCSNDLEQLRNRKCADIQNGKSLFI